ncbi:tRNA pseudouridine(55) synthase TruB [Nigerium massiliense]|uniref:tRNA pseudouridine(55) synthase TruB n=1 Tax=Nigerium massiliense TaxID=1522317 RepID=UPI00058DF049|nr:tRNA pseudouridine(55) synthase TruB [Nigerium massiliense]
MTESGLLVVDKPAGITSHQVVSRARRALGLKKIGHAGTLDPMATGVLILGVGRATRLLGHLTLADKAYSATIRLGQATVTDDAEGDVTDAPGADGLTRSRVEDAVAAYRGDIVQVPSAVSAIKVDGKRSYARVRAGEDVELAGRPVTVSRYDVHGVRPARAGDVAVLDVDVEVECSSGTYIRALARDLGRDLGCGGHLTALRRTRLGPFTVADATWDGVLGELAPGERLSLLLTPMADAARATMPVVEVDAAGATDVSHGRPLALEVPADPTGVVHEGRLLALYKPAHSGSVPVAVLV